MKNKHGYMFWLKLQGTIRWKVLES